MIKCHFSRLLGERKLRVADVARDTGINRVTLGRLYKESVERVELDVIAGLCEYFGIGVGELLEYQPVPGEKPRTKFRAAKRVED
jgi:putative transcriptional regulator